MKNSKTPLIPILGAAVFFAAAAAYAQKYVPANAAALGGSWENVLETNDPWMERFYRDHQDEYARGRDGYWYTFIPGTGLVSRCDSRECSPGEPWESYFSESEFNELQRDLKANQADLAKNKAGTKSVEETSKTRGDVTQAVSGDEKTKAAESADPKKDRRAESKGDSAAGRTPGVKAVEAATPGVLAAAEISKESAAKILKAEGTWETLAESWNRTLEDGSVRNLLDTASSTTPVPEGTVGPAADAALCPDGIFDGAVCHPGALIKKNSDVRGKPNE